MDLYGVFDGSTRKQRLLVACIPIGRGRGRDDLDCTILIVGDFGSIVNAIQSELVRGRFRKMERYKHGATR